MKHTAGPWKNSGCPYGSKQYIWEMIGGERARRLAVVDDEKSARGEPEANARLIAAAPTMIEALRKIQAAFATCTPYEIENMGYNGAEDALDAVEAAISAAEGK